MQMRWIALALGGLCAGPGAALAQSNVTIYGTLNLNFQSVSRTGATAAGTPGATLAGTASGVNNPRRTAVSTDSSNIGFRGIEDLGNGLKATFQIESSVNADGQNPAGLAGRNSKVGIAGGFGEVFYGNWDTPFKFVTYGTRVNDPFYSTDVFGYQSIMSSPGFNQRSTTYQSSSTATQASFDLRAGNTVAYWSPSFSGLRVRAAYSANEGKTDSLNPYLWSAAVNYDNGPLSLLYGYEQHRDVFGLTVLQGTSTGTESKDQAHRLGVGYMFGNTTVSVLWERLDYANKGTVTGVTDYERDAWQVGLVHFIGPHEFKLRYNRAEDGKCSSVAGNCSTDGLGARQWTAGYSLHLSKRSEVYAFYTKIRNDESARYTLTIGGPAELVSGGTSAGAGADPTALGLGIRHTF